MNLTQMQLALSLIGLFIVMIVQIAAGMWWASHINTMMNVISKSLRDIEVTLKEHTSSFVQKTTCDKSHLDIKQAIQKIWEAIDKIRDANNK